MGGNRVVVQHGLRRIHELLPVLDVSRITRHGVHEPEFGQGQADGTAFPEYGHAVGVDVKIAAGQPAIVRLRFLHGIQPTKQRCNSRHQVRQADVLGQIIVRAEPQPRDRVQFTVARR